MNNMNNMMKQAQKMQKQMMKMQEELAVKEYEASAGGDMVQVKINGKMELMKINLAKEIVNPEDIEMLEDLITSAVNSAIKKVNEGSKASMSSLTKGIDIPGFF